MVIGACGPRRCTLPTVVIAESAHRAGVAACRTGTGCAPAVPHVVKDRADARPGHAAATLLLHVVMVGFLLLAAAPAG